MNATQIKSEIESLSGYPFQVFKTRARSMAFDSCIIMQKVKAKHGRLLTGEFLQNELGLTHRFSDLYQKTVREKVSDYDPGFTTKYLLELQAKNSKYIGVTWHARSKKWYAQIDANGKQKGIGYFKSAKKAAIAYNEAAVYYHGDSAKLNQI